MGLVAAHGNSLRGIVKHLDEVSNEDIMKLNLPTGIPFVYELNKETLKPVVSMQFLGDEETVKKAMEVVANQGKAKKADPEAVPAAAAEAKEVAKEPKKAEEGGEAKAEESETKVEEAAAETTAEAPQAAPAAASETVSQEVNGEQ